MRVGMPYQAALHCTVIDWFLTKMSPSEVCQLIETVAHQTQPFSIESGHQEDFGQPGAPLPVNVVKENSQLWSLHRALLTALTERRVEFVHPKFVGDGWRAHVTVQHKTRALNEGQSHTIKALYLIEATGDIETGEKIVQARLTLGDETAA